MATRFDETLEAMTPDPVACAQRWHAFQALGDGLPQRAADLFAALSAELREEYKTMDELARDMLSRLKGCTLNLEEPAFTLRNAGGTTVRTISRPVSERTRLESPRPATRRRLSQPQSNAVAQNQAYVETVQELVSKLQTGNREHVAATLLDAFNENLLNDDLWNALSRAPTLLQKARFNDPLCAWMTLTMARATGATWLACLGLVDVSIQPDTPAKSFAVVSAMSAIPEFEEAALGSLRYSLEGRPGVSEVPYTIFRFAVDREKWSTMFYRAYGDYDEADNTLLKCWLYSIMCELRNPDLAVFKFWEDEELGALETDLRHDALLLRTCWTESRFNARLLTALIDNCMGSPLFAREENVVQLLRIIQRIEPSNRCVTAVRQLASCIDLQRLLCSPGVIAFSARAVFVAFARRYYAARVGLIKTDETVARGVAALARFELNPFLRYIDDSNYVLFKAIVNDSTDLTPLGKMVVEAIKPNLQYFHLSHLPMQAMAAADEELPTKQIASLLKILPYNDDDFNMSMQALAVQRGVEQAPGVTPRPSTRPPPQPGRSAFLYRVIG